MSNKTQSGFKHSQKPCAYKMIIGDKYYIGATATNLSRRKSAHIYRLKQGKHTLVVQEHYDKFKTTEFQLLELCDAADILKVEQKYLDLAKDDINCLNMVWTAGKCTGVKRSEEHKEAVRLAALGNSYRKGCTFIMPQETKDKMSKKLKEGYASGRIKPSRAGRGPAGEKQGMSKLTEVQVYQALELHANGWKHVHISELFNVTRENITMILNGRNWKVQYNNFHNNRANLDIDVTNIIINSLTEGTKTK